jgi:predicted DNA-binding transcriptional regulator YafY
MTQEALRNILLESQRNWSRGRADQTRVPQRSIDRYLQDLSETVVPKRERPGRHKGRRARVVGFPYAVNV